MTDWEEPHFLLLEIEQNLPWADGFYIRQFVDGNHYHMYYWNWVQTYKEILYKFFTYPHGRILILTEGAMDVSDNVLDF